jgi:hypothetical protein
MLTPKVTCRVIGTCHPARSSPRDEHPRGELGPYPAGASAGRGRGMNTSVENRLVDEAAHAYVDWRKECLAVWDAYGRWTGARTVDARLAFAAYKAALEIEEQACAFYASVIRRAGNLVTTGPRHRSASTQSERLESVPEALARDDPRARGPEGIGRPRSHMKASASRLARLAQASPSCVPREPTAVAVGGGMVPMPVPLEADDQDIADAMRLGHRSRVGLARPHESGPPERHLGAVVWRDCRGRVKLQECRLLQPTASRVTRR